MKRIILLTLTLLLTFSCGKKNDPNDIKIKIAKDYLTKQGAPEIDIKNAEFHVFNISDNEAYSFLVNKDLDLQEAMPEAKRGIEIDKNLLLLEKAKGKKVFSKVVFYKVEIDTSAKGVIIINDNNQVIGWH